jgi:hypothetical protein
MNETHMELNLLTFLLYLLVAVNTTYFLGKSLYTHGEVFLDSIFVKSEIVKPLNKVLLMGFYLINIGFVLIFFTQGHEINSLKESIEILADKLGIVYLVLGGMHLFNVLLFIHLEKNYNFKI